MPINSNQDQQTKLLEIVNISTKDIEKCIGVIGFGDMGRLYVEAFLRAGYTNIHICDIPERFNNLAEWATGKAVTAHRDGTSVVRICDFVLFSVQAALINKVVGMHGPAMKQGSIACGQTSVKDPEIKAFDKYLPPDVQVVTCHSLHGPSISPKGQPLVVMRHRCSDDAKFEFVVRLLSSLQSRIVYLTPDEHDHITADTQAITHLAFLSMGTAWKTQNCFPWEVPQYTGGIEHAKILMTLRIYSSKWHVYSGLAFLNPHALTQVAQFSKSVSVLFKLMIQEKEAEFRSRIYKVVEVSIVGSGVCLW